MSNSKVVLKSYSSIPRVYGDSNVPIVMEYLVAHDNTKSTLDQILIIKNETGEGWVAELIIDNFPVQETPQDAAIKLAEWLERLSKAIRLGNYNNITM